MALFNDDMCLLSGPSPRGESTGAAAGPKSAEPVALSHSLPGRCVFPLTRSQEGIWVEYQSEPTSTKYNLTLEWNLERRPEEEHVTILNIIKAINKLTNRHAVLRSMVTALDGRAQCKEFAAGTVDPEVQMVYRETTCVAEAQMKKMLRRPFDLQNELPARWLVLRDAKVLRVYLVGHHIVVDGASMSLISKEFLELVADVNAVLPPLADFSQMHMVENAWIGSESYLQSRDIVLSQVRDKNNGQWPAAQAVAKRSPGQDYRKIDSWSTFSKAELETWSNAYKTSWFRVAISLVGLLVADKTRPQLGLDEVLGVAFAGRPKDMGACAGHFANTLPVKIPIWQALKADPTGRSFRSLVGAVSKNMSTIKKAELVAPIEVARACRSINMDYQPPRVAVTYSPKLARKECRLFPVEGSWDLFFCFLEYEEDVKLGVIYDPEIFSAKTISDMKVQFERLITLTKVDQVQLDNMVNWLPRHLSLPATPTVTSIANPHRHLHHWFDAHAQSNPSSIAIHSTELGISITYGELYASTEQKAQSLRSRGVGRESTVVLHLRRGYTVFEWMLATLKAGGAFVYLNPEFAEAQKQKILSNCRSDMVIDEIQAEELISSYTASKETEADLETVKYSTKDEDLAYLIYTSGSTGEPKGVMIEHGSIARFVEGAAQVFKTGFGARVLQFAPLSFDASIMEWTAALCTGATLCLAEHPKQLIGEYLADVLEQNQVTWMQTTPTALSTLPLAREYRALRQIVAGGEAPSRDVLQKWHGRVDVVNAYGPTEAAIGVTFNAFDRTEKLPEVISAGQPTPTTRIYICAEGFGPTLQPGFQGEICLAGPQLARGYCGQAQLTNKCFAVHSNGVRMYRSGDRGMLLEDGSVVVLGRMDRELKIRGHRIAPEEVEKAIMDADVGVTEASVQSSVDGLELAAVVAPDTVSTRSLWAGLRRLLPDYKVPTKVTTQQSLPKNTSGKIDHKAVRKSMMEAADRDMADGMADDSPGIASSSDEKDVLLPKIATANNEDAVLQIWQALLATSEQLPMDVNFFDIGGHSLLVPKLHKRLQDAFPGSAVRLVDLFHQSTIRQQAVIFGGKQQIRALPAQSVTSRRRLKSRNSTAKTSPTLSKRSSQSSLRSTAFASPETPATSISLLEERPDIGIIGLAGRFPQAKSADEFYHRLLDESYSGIVETPSKKQVLPGNIWVPKAGVLQDIEQFDHAFWHITKEEATDMDPQQRLFLEVAHEALTDAGVDLATMDGARTGIFVGAANNSYHNYTESVTTDPFLKEHRATIAPSLSARTAYHLNVSGPNVTVQVNCASSTVALSQACDAIRLGRCDMAIVGGVSVQLFEGGYATQDGQIFSPRGECNPFDAHADGTVPADAVTAVILKRYSDASAEHTPVYAKILGTGIGSDGAVEKAGFQVPSPRGQAEVIKSAWRDSRSTPYELKYAEMHGSGTPVGDALELEGISLAIKELGGSATPFTVGSVKGNIGNTQHASGLVSLIKLCKSMQNGVVPATKGIQRPNEMINYNLPIKLATKETPVRRGDILSICASGWGGVNTHTLLGFPEERLQKRSTIPVPRSTFNRQKLAAPPKLASTVTVPASESTGAVTSIFARHAADILGCEVGADTNLKQCGLDSKVYVTLIKAASAELTGHSIGVKGLMLPVCTPAALAQLYNDQAPAAPRQQQQKNITCSVLTRGEGASVLILPGSEGSLAGAAPFINRLPQDATVMTVEHPGLDPNQDTMGEYVSGVLTHLQPSTKLVIVGLSLGGIYAPRVAGMLGQHEDWQNTAIDVFMLDSPGLLDSVFSSKAALSSLRHPYLTFNYIGATKGGFANDETVKAQWQATFPGGKMYEVECGHTDLWGEVGCEQTAKIMEESMKPNSSLCWH